MKTYADHYFDHANTRLIATIVSLLSGVLLISIKYFLYRNTGSVAILSDIFETVISVVFIGYVQIKAIYFPTREREETSKKSGIFEYFSAGFGGPLIVAAALFILWSAMGQVFSPQPMTRLLYGFTILLIANLLNLGLGLGLITWGNRLRSSHIRAEGKHLLAVFSISIAVLLGLLSTWITDSDRIAVSRLQLMNIDPYIFPVFVEKTEQGIQKIGFRCILESPKGQKDQFQAPGEDIQPDNTGKKTVDTIGIGDPGGKKPQKNRN